MQDCESCPFVDLNLHDWKSSLKGINLRSARGACGFSPKDVIRMPDILTEWLFQIFRKAENGADWPQRLTTARVVMLAKPGEDVDKPLSCRPITVLSVLYRLRSRFRSLQVLKHLNEQLPPQVAGVASKISADCLTAMVGDILEVAMGAGEGLCGLVVDLSKCFNLVPRLPLEELMHKIGIPQQYTRAHQQMLRHLTRLVEISGKVGDFVPSSCGIPEGCAYSVVSMTVLTALAAHVLKFNDPEVLVAMFADNWGLLTTSVQSLQATILRLQRFCCSMGMIVSPKKSWVWGTTPRIRKDLKRVTFDGQELQIKHTAKDLGCDVTYTKKKNKKVTKERWQKSIRVLKRVRTKKLPRKFKGTMCTALGPGIVGYGSELQSHTNPEIHTLRSAMASALGYHKSGASSYLVLNVTGQYVDPQIRLLRRRIRFFRRFCQIFPQRTTSFLSRVGKDNAPYHVGIALNFRKTMSNVGWTCGEGGRMKHTSGLIVNWFYDSLSFVFHMVDKAWSHWISNKMNERKDFDIKCFSPQGFRRSLDHRDIRHQSILCAIACGRHMTNDGLQHYSCYATSNQCPLCGGVDSKKHRLFECVKLEHCRKQHKDINKWVQEQPQAVQAFGIVPDDFQALLHKQITFKYAFVFSFPDNGERDKLYTDGSCFFPDDWECSLGGAAVISVEDTGFCWKLLNRQALPTGDHSAFRGESFGILLALNHRRKCDIFIDCEAALDRLQTMLDDKLAGRRIRVGDHNDIWMHIARHVENRQHGDIKCFKVKAHCNWKDAHDIHHQRMAFFSEKVDQEAKNSILIDNKATWKRINTIYERKQHQIKCVGKYHDFLCDIHLESFKQSPKVLRLADEINFDDFCRVEYPVEHWVGLEHDIIQQCPFGITFAKRFADWWNGLRWGQSGAVSIVELYIAFCFHSKSMAPVCVVKRVYELRDESIIADHASNELSVQTRIFLRMVQWWYGHFDQPISTLSKGTKDLTTLGYSFPLWGFDRRPQLMCGTRAAQELWRYFHSGGRAVRTLHKAWSIYHDHIS